MLIDLQNKAITGKEAERVLDTAGITTNANTIPFDTRSAFDPSGMRVGTPTVTTRGMKQAEMKQIGQFIARALDARDDKDKLEVIRKEVEELCKAFPVY